MPLLELTYEFKFIVDIKVASIGEDIGSILIEMISKS